MGAVAGGAIAAVGALGAASTESSAASSAANAQVQSEQIAANTEQSMYNQQLQMEQPWVNAGTSALGQLTSGLASGGQFTQPYTMADFQSGPESGLYQTALQQGTEAMQKQMAAGGQGLSTNAIVGAGQLATNLASSYYNQGESNYMAQQQLQLGGLESVAGLGQSSTNASANASANAASALSGLETGAGNATAAGIVGSANANAAGITGVSNALGNTLSQSTTLNTLGALFDGSGLGGTSMGASNDLTLGGNMAGAIYPS